jgi:hypothetical protein
MFRNRSNLTLRSSSSQGLARSWRGLLRYTLLLTCLLAVFVHALTGINAAANRLFNHFNKREVAAQVCGAINAFRPATTLGAGSLRINGTTYAIAPGVVIGGQSLIGANQSLCLELILNNSGEIALGSTVTGAQATVCGGVDSYTPSSFVSPGSITINGTSYAIAPDFTLAGASVIAKGANVCLTAVLNGGGQIIRPSQVAANVTPSLNVCGAVSVYTPATANAPGLVTLGGMSFTVAPGVMIPGLSVGGNQCLSAFTDVLGRLIAPSSAGANASGRTKICGTVSEFKNAAPGIEGLVRFGSNLLPLAAGSPLPGGNGIQIGSSVCLNLVAANGQVVAGSSFGDGTQECPQLTVPITVHGVGEGNLDTYLLPERAVFTISSANANGAMTFPVANGSTGQLTGLAASAPNSVVRAVSCSDSYWDFLFTIGTKGMVEGDMVKIVLQSPNSNNGHVLAMFTAQNGGFVLNSVSPWVSLRANGSTNPVPAGRFFPVYAPGPGGYQFTSTFVMVFAMDSRSPLDGCFQFAIELKRAGGGGMLSFVPLQSIVRRKDDTTEEGIALDSLVQGFYPTTKPCLTVCQPCNDQPPPTSLSGFVYCDLNNDSMKQAGEPGIAGVAVTLTGTSVIGPVNLPATTDANGAYSFNNLRPGTYTITETQPASALDGLDALGNLGGTLGNDVLSNIPLVTTSGVNYNFGEICNGALSGFVYCDGNNDGVRQGGEGGLAGVTITLTGTSVMGAVNRTAQTDANGNYVFDNLPPGTYTITETQPNGFGDGLETLGTLGGTPGNDVFSNIAVNNNQGAGYAFGEACNRTLSGFVYCDSNNDGLRQGGEIGIAGVTITLMGTTAQGAVNRTTQTDGNGNYSFTNLQPGTYTITETQPAGYGDGLDTIGSLGGTVGNDVHSNIVVGNTDGIGYAFGERCGGNLSGFVYCDTNNDGLRQAGEGGVPGVTITLSGAANRTAQTDGNGFYSFANLQPGTYAITETQPPGFADGKDTLGSIGGTVGNDTFTNIVLTNTDGVGYAFGEGCPGGLSGYVYCDFDDDGMREANENGIAGVTIQLTGTDANGAVGKIAITNSMGFYQFPNLLPGTYKLTELQPPGNVDGKDMIGTLGGVVANDMFSNIVVNNNIGAEYNFGEACMPIKCDTICYTQPREWLLRTRYPNGAILVAGVNFNNPISIQRNLAIIRNVLQGFGTGMLNLNREFVATQLSLASAGGTGSPVVFNTYWSPLRCSGVIFTPVTLSNGYYMSPDTLLNDLVLQAQAAIRENRTADMQILADILIILNQKC